jgi:hypothetical protein
MTGAVAVDDAGPTTGSGRGTGGPMSGSTVTKEDNPMTGRPVSGRLAL